MSKYPRRSQFWFGHPQLTCLTLNSRQAIKKYVKANNKVQFTSETQFDSMFNKALKSGVDKGEFTQPKGGPPRLRMTRRTLS
jgi:hypothetical protein